MIEELKLILPEIFVMSMASIILLGEVFIPKKYRLAIYYLSLITVAGGFLLTLHQTPAMSQLIFHKSYLVDKFASIFKCVIFVLLACIFIYSKLYMCARNLMNGEFYSLTLFSMLGMMVVISAANFLSLYLGLELLVLPLYVLIVMVKDRAAYSEAAMKYFILGSLGAGILLYGISLVYGAVGSFEFAAIAQYTGHNHMLALGMLLVISGVVVEFGAVPFHMWLPDVYEGSPTAVTMIIGTIPKIAVFAMAYRLLTLAFTNLVHDWQQFFLIVAVLSIGLGNVTAIVQTNIKRMLAYSTIGHIGFILLGLFVADSQGFIAPIYYTITYTLMSLAAFAVIICLSEQGFEADKISDFSGLNKLAPWLAFMMLLIMFSLAGVPPLVGFYAKFLILQNVVNAGYPALAAIALVFTVIGAFFYLRIIRVMYFDVDKREPHDLSTTGMSWFGNALLTINGLALLLLGILPWLLLYLCIYSLQ